MSDKPKDEKVSLGQPAPQPAPQVYNVPTSTVQLPSAGKVYSDSSTLSGLKEVEIRSMTARDEDILSSRTLLKQGKAISALIQSCIMDKSVDPDEMLVGDRNAVLVALRAAGYGRAYETKITCPSCEIEFEHSFDLGAMNIVPLSADPITEYENLFEFLLPMSKQRVTFKLLTGKEEKEMTKLLERQKKTRGIGAVEESVTTRLFYQIVSLSGETDRAKLSRSIKNLIAGDSLALRKYVEKVSPGLDLVDYVDCPSCGEGSEVDMPMGVDFFWPGS